MLYTSATANPYPPDTLSIARPNYGVVFTKLPTPIINGHASYPLKLKINLTLSFDISKPDSVFGLIFDQDSKYQAAMANLSDSQLLLEYSRAIHLLKTIADQISGHTNRPKRSSGTHYTADLFRKIFGVATQAEIDALVDEMSSTEVYLARELHLGREMNRLLINMTDFNYRSLSSFTIIQNDTDYSLKEMESQIDSINYNLSVSLVQLQAQSNRNFYNNYLLSAATSQLLSMQSYNRDLEVLRDCLTLLSRNLLPRTLVPSSVLRGSLEKLGMTLLTRPTKFSIANIPLNYYYENQVESQWVDGSILEINIPVPISASSPTYDIFAITKFPVPIDTSNVSATGSTTVLNIPDFLAVSQTQENYIQLSVHDYRMCTGESVLNCNLPLPTLTPDSPTCSLALFLDVPDAVHRLCRFKTAILAPITLSAHPLSHNQYLLSTPFGSSTLTCPHSPPREVPTVAWSTVTVPCGCVLTNGNIELVNTNLSCVVEQSIPQMIHCAVNLPVWRTFSIPPRNISGITTSNVPFRHPMSNLEQRRLSHMQRYASLANEAGTLHGIANQIARDGETDMTRLLASLDTHTSSPIFETINMATALLALIISLATNLRLTTILVASSMANRLPVANSEYEDWRAQLQTHDESWWKESFKRRQLQIKDKVEVQTNSIRYITLDIVIAIAAVTVTLYILYKVWKCCGRCTPCTTGSEHRNPYIGLKMTYGWSTVVLKCLPLNHDKNSVTLNGYAPRYSAVRLSRPLGRQLYVNWEDTLKLTINCETARYTLPFYIDIPVRHLLTVAMALRSGNPNLTVVLVFDDRHMEVPAGDRVSIGQRDLPPTSVLSPIRSSPTPSYTVHGLPRSPIMADREMQPSGSKGPHFDATKGTITLKPRPKEVIVIDHELEPLDNASDEGSARCAVLMEAAEVLVAESEQATAAQEALLNVV